MRKVEFSIDSENTATVFVNGKMKGFMERGETEAWIYIDCYTGVHQLRQDYEYSTKLVENLLK